ncbi:MAG: chemotaxis protein CheA [Woeseiaceae bacterium]
MTFDMSQFLATFYEESFEGLDIMETELLALDVGEADLETINTIFRAAHSIKGGSGTFGLNDVAKFTHVMETLLDEMRDGKRDVTQEGVTILLESVDILREMLSTLQAEEELDVESIAIVKQKLDNLLAGTNSETPAATETTETVEETPEQTTCKNTAGWIINFKPHTEMLQTGNDPVRMFRELEALGEITVDVDTSMLPEFLMMEPENSSLAWILTLKGEITESDVNEVFDWVDDECDLTLTAIEEEVTEQAPIEIAAVEDKGKEEAAHAKKSAAKAKRKATTESSSIRVSIDKVDDLINMVGELVITQSMLSQLGEEEEFNEEHLEKLKTGLIQLERNTREMQENVMRIRMLPISFVFQRFPRLVHDLSAKLDKKIELVLSGESTELDKTVMEKIGDPLVHLVRNSLDHGIEIPADRVAAGKNETGQILLNAFHEGGKIVIEITDDGAGLNLEKILSKAKSSGIVGENDNLSDEDIADLIFRPGFSTADVVSDVSGRGVGMDVVRRNIRALGGTVEVQTQAGQGSIFTIRLPLTLAILDGQSVVVGDEVYIIPLVAIIESVQIDNALVNGITGQAEVYRLRDEYIPIVKLHSVFNVKPTAESMEEGLLVIVEAEGKKVALLVDDLLGQQQVVIKSLETNFKSVEGISGATILGDGTVALILDVTGLISISKNNQRKTSSPDDVKAA